jgi:hypothetical protein
MPIELVVCLYVADIVGVQGSLTGPAMKLFNAQNKEPSWLPEVELGMGDVGMVVVAVVWDGVECAVEEVTLGMYWLEIKDVLSLRDPGNAAFTL